MDEIADKLLATVAIRKMKCFQCGEQVYVFIKHGLNEEEFAQALSTPVDCPTCGLQHCSVSDSMVWH